MNETDRAIVRVTYMELREAPAPTVGRAIGFCEFDLRGFPEIELKNCGLVAEAQGRGLGPWLLSIALSEEWISGPARIWLHTDTWDHPGALRMYQRSLYGIGAPPPIFATVRLPTRVEQGSLMDRRSMTTRPVLVTILTAGILLSAVAFREFPVPDALLSGASPFKESARHMIHGAGLADLGHRILGPFSDIAARTADALYEALLPSSRSGTLHWPLLALTLAIALAFFVIRAGRGARGADGRERAMGLGEYLLPREIYTHPSARVDIGLYLLDRALMPLWLVLGVGLIAPYVERSTLLVAQDLFGPSPALTMTLGWKLVYGLVTLLVADMIFYFTHLFGHRTQIGWAFHKVHHSAAVLTPLTRYREHFVEGILYSAGAAAGLGFCGGAFAYLFRGPITQITVMNLGIFVFLFAVNGNFRHYHVSFRYPPWLEHWLQSPGMHHIHHSYLPHHRDKNLGLVTSVWDRIVGTLYIGSPYEETPWGLGPDEQAHYSTFVQNVFGPFREVYRLLAGRRTLSQET